MSDTLYDKNTNIYLDKCWKNSKDNYNDNIENYNTYYNNTSEVKKTTGTLPEIANEHINLRGRPGYGLSDAYLIDIYSSLRNNPDSYTHDKCHIQLFERIFKGGPILKGASGDIHKELDVLSGSDSRLLPAIGSKRGINNFGTCNKSEIMEKQMNNIMPLIDTMKDLQDADNIVPVWTRGGEDSRSYINKVNYSKK